MAHGVVVLNIMSLLCMLMYSNVKCFIYYVVSVTSLVVYQHDIVYSLLM